MTKLINKINEIATMKSDIATIKAMSSIDESTKKIMIDSVASKMLQLAVEVEALITDEVAEIKQLVSKEDSEESEEEEFIFPTGDPDMDNPDVIREWKRLLKADEAGTLGDEEYDYLQGALAWKENQVKLSKKYGRYVDLFKLGFTKDQVDGLEWNFMLSIRKEISVSTINIDTFKFTIDGESFMLSTEEVDIIKKMYLSEAPFEMGRGVHRILNRMK